MQTSLFVMVLTLAEPRPQDSKPYPNPAWALNCRVINADKYHYEFDI